ncbi:MAG: chemotaxis protein CheB [Rubripirellula sp.]
MTTRQSTRRVKRLNDGCGCEFERGPTPLCADTRVEFGCSHGGLVITETPDSAKFDGMPSSAIATGDVHQILAPEAMGDLLAQITSVGDLLYSN